MAKGKEALPIILGNPDIREVVTKFLALGGLTKVTRLSKPGLAFENRRLDSFARLIDDPDAVCTAICFDGQNLIIAANGQISKNTYVNKTNIYPINLKIPF